MAELATDIGAHEIAFEAFGVRVLVSVSGAGHVERLPALLPPGWQRCRASAVEKRFVISPDPSGTFQLSRDARLLTKGLELDLALELLESQVRGYVALNAPDRIFVHAGAVARGDRTIVLPGMSFAGKTSLVAALVRAGAIYYSDEYAVLDQNGLVHPYARPLSIRDEHHLQTDHHVESLGGIAGDEPLPIGAVVVATYRPEATWRPKRLSPGEGVLALLSNTVPAKTRPKEAMRAITRAVERAEVVLASDRDEAEDIAPLLLAELDR